MSDDNLITSEETPRSHFTMVPNIIDDLGLDPYSFRLYVHLRRVVGENGGRCWQSQDLLAQLCNMSRGKVSECKQILADLGLIRIEKMDQGPGRASDLITVLDIWDLNRELFTGRGSVRLGEKTLDVKTWDFQRPPGGLQKPQDGLQKPQDGLQRPPGGPKNNHGIPHEEKHEEEKDMGADAPLHLQHWILPTYLCKDQTPIAPGTIAPPARPEQVTCPECQAIQTKSPPRAHQLMFAAICWICRWDWTVMSKDDKGKVNQLVGKLNKAKGQDPVTPVDVIEFGEWWDHSGPWESKDGPPRPDLIMHYWLQFRDWQLAQRLLQQEVKAAATRVDQMKAAAAKLQEEDPELFQAMQWWDTARQNIRLSMTRETYIQWIKVLKPVGLDGPEMIILCPTEAVRAWCENRLNGIITDNVKWASEDAIRQIKYILAMELEDPDVQDLALD